MLIENQGVSDEASPPWQHEQWCIPEVSAEFVAAMEDVPDLHEIEISIFACGCLSSRVASMQDLWRFTSRDARERLYAVVNNHVDWLPGSFLRWNY